MITAAFALAVALLLPATDARAAGASALEASPLAQDVTRFLIDHPDASLQQAAQFANRRVREVGMNFSFDAHADAKDKSVTLNADGRELSAAIGEEGACGERFTSVAAVRVTKARIELPQGGKIVVAQRPASMRLDSMQVMSPDLQNVLTDTEVPSETFPHGVTTSGGILLALPLGNGAIEWWSRRQAKSKFFRGDSPYLVFEMADGSPRFSEDEKVYFDDSEPLSNAPADPKNAYVRYWKFKTTHLVVRFSAPCT